MAHPDQKRHCHSKLFRPLLDEYDRGGSPVAFLGFQASAKHPRARCASDVRVALMGTLLPPAPSRDAVLFPLRRRARSARPHPASFAALRAENWVSEFPRRSQRRRCIDNPALGTPDLVGLCEASGGKLGGISSERVYGALTLRANTFLRGSSRHRFRHNPHHRPPV